MSPTFVDWERLGGRLSFAALLINASTLACFYGATAVLTSTKELNFVQFTHDVLKYCVFPLTLLGSTLLYVVFAVQYRQFYLRKLTAVDRKQALQANQMVLFQMVMHIVLCAIPNGLATLNSPFIRLRMKWVDSMEPFNGVMFSMSVLLASFFTAIKMRPRRVFLRVASSGSSPCTK
uniref:G protein-coupled receptor n=1 Tax=Steinernema glaseri TaxID=37863 RepID=A0A1I8ASW2_9BILA